MVLSTDRCYLDRSVDIDQMQQRLRHLGQELPEEHQDLLNHSRGILGKGHGEGEGPRK